MPPTHGNLEEELREATRLARMAGHRILALREDGFERSFKDDDSIVTTADHAADAIILQGLTTAFPGDGILTEETGHVGWPRTGRTWVVDPLDGTKAFARGLPGFCVMIGLIVGNEAVLGVVYEPLDDRLYTATAGSGTFVLEQGARDPVQVRVSSRSELAEMPLVTSQSLSAERRALILARTGLAEGPAIHSVGVKVGLLVRGLGDVYYSHHGLSTWDTVAPALILQEAGGVFTTMDGQPLRYDLALGMPEQQLEGASLATNGARHAELLETFRTLTATR